MDRALNSSDQYKTRRKINVLRREWSTVSCGAKKKKKTSKISMTKGSLDLETERSLVVMAKAV